jgi:predicted CXXCH cytochrome family protein
VAAPHHLQADELESFLRGIYVGRFLGQHPDLSARVNESLNDSPRPLPGRLTKLEEAARDEIARLTLESRELLFQEKVDKIKRYLFDGQTSCGECHHIDREQGQPVRVQPVNQRGLWFESARFNHAMHRALNCIACHNNAETATKMETVRMPAIDVCRQCHAPASPSGGGARHDCVECHRYHNGDHPQEGLGARERDPARHLDNAASLLQGRSSSIHP